MTPDDFRRHAHELVDWMADYLRDVGKMPVVPDVAPGDIRRRLPHSPPAGPEPFAAVFDDFQQVILPGMAHWNHPGWFAYFPANTSPPSILAEMLTAALGAQCMSWATSPAATELEQVTIEWLRRMLALPDGMTGVIQDTASTATLVALITARERALRSVASRAAEIGPHPPLAVYASREAHSSVAKGARLAGYAPDRLRLIDVDEHYAMAPAALDAAIADDLGAGIGPACVVATVGTTSSTAIDPLPAIGAICRRHGVWLHVDAAYAGTAAIAPECRGILQGVELADSFVFNPHKWMLVNFDCSAYFVRDVDALLGAFAADPEYLRTGPGAETTNFRDWGIQLGRRFRALKLWFVIRSYGVDGLRELIRTHLVLAQEFAGWVEAARDFELMAPVPLGLVCFRYRPAATPPDDPGLDQLNAQLLRAVNASGRVYLTHTRLGGRYVLRLAVGQRTTAREHVESAWRLLREAAGAMPAGPPPPAARPATPEPAP